GWQAPLSLDVEKLLGRLVKTLGSTRAVEQIIGIAREILADQHRRVRAEINGFAHAHRVVLPDQRSFHHLVALAVAEDALLLRQPMRAHKGVVRLEYVLAEGAWLQPVEH